MMHYYLKIHKMKEEFSKCMGELNACYKHSCLSK